MKGGPYLAIVEDKAEAPNHRFEWRESICRFLCSTEEQFGCGSCSGLPLLGSAPTRSVWFTLVRARSISDLIRNDGAVFIAWRDLSEAELKIMLFTYSLVLRYAGSKTWPRGDRHRQERFSSPQHCFPLDWVHSPPRHQRQPLNAGMSSSHWLHFLRRQLLSPFCHLHSGIFHLACGFSLGT